LKNKIDDGLIEKRKQIIAGEQFKNVQKNNKNKIGRKFEVLIEDIAGKKAYGRAYFQAPEIDNNFIIDLKKDNIKSGEFKNIIVSDVKDYDIIGRVDKAGKKS
jgi:ribosomal protein S12 methylthiotransferase